MKAIHNVFTHPLTLKSEAVEPPKLRLLVPLCSTAFLALMDIYVNGWGYF